MISLLKEGEVLKEGLNVGWIGGPVFKYKKENTVWYLRIRLKNFQIYSGKIHATNLQIIDNWYKNV